MPQTLVSPISDWHGLLRCLPTDLRGKRLSGLYKRLLPPGDIAHTESLHRIRPLDYRPMKRKRPLCGRSRLLHAKSAVWPTRNYAKHGPAGYWYSLPRRRDAADSAGDMRNGASRNGDFV